MEVNSLFNNIHLENNDDGTCNLLLSFSSDTEFGLEFLHTDKLKNNASNVLSFVKKHADKIKIDAVKILVNGVVITTMSYSAFMNVYGAETPKYSMAYLYTGNATQQISYIDRTNGALGTVSPSYFDIITDGTLKVNTISAELVNHAHSQGMKVIPFLSNHWNKAAGILALNNAENLSTDIANYISQYNLDGINVDIENVTEFQRDQYTAFVAMLRAKIPAAKEVSVAVAANPNGWVTGWQGSYDYTALANNSDHLMIMAYDEHWNGSDVGPVSSITFVENTIKYALTKTTDDKIVIGLPFYGRIWSADNTFNGDGITLDTVNKMISIYNATVTYDTVAQSAKAVFTVNPTDQVSTLNGNTLTPGTYTIWYENDSSIQAKMALVNKYNLKGVGAWALGQEPSTIWVNYSAWLNQTAAVTPVAPAPTISITGTVNASILNVRSEPSTNSKVVASLKKGSAITITGTSNGWYTIRLANGQTAYVSSNYVKENSVAKTTTSTTAKTGSVNTALLNVRSTPSTKAKVLATLKRNAPITILSTSNGWSAIRLANGQTAYVSSNLITQNATNATTPTVATTTNLSTTSKTAVVTTGVLNVRSLPTTKAKVLKILNRGTSVTILSSNNGWYSIKLANGQTGYISSSLVKLK
jgi:spore germination protein YaaH/uncharacterized protein YgiM (DUF1202 family)